MTIALAVGAIRGGELVGMPTDTVYGIGVDPLSQRAVSRLFELKGRTDEKPIGLLAASLEQAEGVAEIRGVAAELGRLHWPGALTLVVTPRLELAEGVGDPRAGTVGVRVPDHPLLFELLTITGPLAVTSANVSGGPEAKDDVEARALFGDRVAFYLPGEAPGGRASTVIDVTGDHVLVLRQGPVRV